MSTKQGWKPNQDTQQHRFYNKVILCTCTLACSCAVNESLEKHDQRGFRSDSAGLLRHPASATTVNSHIRNYNVQLGLLIDDLKFVWLQKLGTMTTALRLGGAQRARTSMPARGAPTQAVKDVFMPALSSTMTEGKVVQWLKSEGDAISKGEALVVVESDKADMDVESFEDGFLGSIVVDEGGTANVGSPIAFIAETEAEIADAQAKGGSSAPAAPAPAEETEVRIPPVQYGCIAYVWQQLGCLRLCNSCISSSSQDLQNLITNSVCMYELSNKAVAFLFAGNEQESLRHKSAHP